jgi:hypothetical protein
MENPGKRLIVLEGDEVEALYGRPASHTKNEFNTSPFLLKKNRCLIKTTGIHPELYTQIVGGN